MTELEQRLEIAMRERDLCLSRLAEEKMARDLERIQGEDSDVCELHALGEEFIKLIENGIDALIAFRAVKCSCEQIPEPIGEICSDGGRESEYYSSRELDRLTAKDLENPAVFKKAIQSLKKL